jgi:hypothetical protein
LGRTRWVGIGALLTDAEYIDEERPAIRCLLDQLGNWFAGAVTRFGFNAD